MAAGQKPPDREGLSKEEIQDKAPFARGPECAVWPHANPAVVSSCRHRYSLDGSNSVIRTRRTIRNVLNALRYEYLYST